MIVRYTADVTGTVIHSDHEEFQLGDFQAELNFKEADRGSKILESISIQRPLSEEEVNEITGHTKFEPPTADERGEIQVGLPDKIDQDAKTKLQTFESFGGIHGITEVDWKYAEVELEAESEAEREKLDVFSWDLEEKRPPIPHNWEFDLDRFDWEYIEDIRVPLSFFRRGKQLQEEGDYVNAYTNFYLVLEGLYAEHSTGVEAQFLDSEELVNVTESAFPNAMESLGDEIDEFFEFYDKEKSPEGYLKLLVTIRHNLNHFFGDDGGPHNPNPFQSERFESLSMAIMHLTVLLLIRKVHGVEDA